MAKPPTVFHACTTRYPGISLQIVTDLKLCPAYDPANPPVSPGPFHSTKAIWDTGATRSVITNDTALAMGLTPVGSVRMNHAGGACDSNTYMLNFILPNNVTITGVLASECATIIGGVGALIGMDIIARGDFAITNVQGSTCMTFRIPSVAPIDYVLEANRITYAGVARNHPCPCGKIDPSGKPLKFKMCCQKSLGLD
ncbi:MAG: aspartyl protease family protein [Syntrophobacteraceae bacterium]